MNQWRAPYFPPPYYQNQQAMQPFDISYPNQNVPNPTINQQPPVTPYQQFAKPQQPTPWDINFSQMQGMPPNQPLQQKSTGFMTYFQDKNGQVDIDKMLNTVGQMANTFQQVSPLVKGLGSFVKGFKY